MPCPESTEITGEKDLWSFCRSSQAQAREEWLQEVADVAVEIGKRYECPLAACAVITVDKIKINVVSLHTFEDRMVEYAFNPIGDTDFWVQEPRYVKCWRAYGTFRYSITVTCSAPTAAAVRQTFIDAFLKAAKAFYDPFFTGWGGNVTFGKKCDEWADWMVTWIRENDWKGHGIRKIEKVIYKGAVSDHVL